jgi:hypothetical protein
MVLIPHASARWHPVDLLLCGHHYLSSKAALAAAGAIVMDETGAIVDPAPVSNENADPRDAQWAGARRHDRQPGTAATCRR